MKKIFALVLVLCMALSASALADYQITSDSQVDTTVVYEARQYDYYIVYIPAEIYIDGGRSGDFSIELEVDERYNVPYSCIGVSVDYNDTYGEWADDVEGETIWNRGFFINNDYDNGFCYQVYNKDDGRQLWPSYLDGTEFEGRRFDDENLNIYDDMQRGYDSTALFWEVGDNFDIDHYSRSNMRIECKMDFAQLMEHTTYYGRLTFGVWNYIPEDNNYMLERYGKYWEKDEDDPDDRSKWIIRDNDGQYIKDEETGEWVEAPQN